MSRSFIYTLLILFTSGLVQTSAAQKVGGPCSYKHTVYPAKVLEVVGDTAKVYVNFEITFSPQRRDTISYYRFYGRQLTRKEAKAKGVTAGAVFKYIESHITSGACNPFIKRLTLEPYKE